MANSVCRALGQAPNPGPLRDPPPDASPPGDVARIRKIAIASYHANVKTFTRSKGQRSTAAAAYRAGIEITDDLTGEKFNYKKRGGVADTIMLAPKDAPEWANDPSKLWNAAEKAERINGLVAREFEFALPHELTNDQRAALVKDMREDLVERYGFALQASTHEPHLKGADERNHHVHILATTRRMGPEGLTEKNAGT